MPGGMIKEEPGLSNSQMSTQPHLFRSHTGVLERGVGREPLLSHASTQELEAALAVRREKSQVSRDREEREKEREQKKPRLLGAVAPMLPEFGGSTLHARKGGEEERGVEHFDLTGDDDLMGEGGAWRDRPRRCRTTMLRQGQGMNCRLPTPLRLPGRMHRHGFIAFFRASS